MIRQSAAPGSSLSGLLGTIERSERPPHYWELEIAADTPGIDFSALFLVPVYESRRKAAKLAPVL